MTAVHALLGLFFAWAALLPRASALPPRPDATLPVVQLVTRGEAALRAGDSISAIGYFRDAVTRAPRDPRGYAALGRAYLAVHEPARAREAFEAGARNTRGSEAIALGLVESYEQLGERARALAAARALAHSAEDVLVAHEARARLAERTGAFSEALGARRAKLAWLRREGESARPAREQEAVRVRALELLLGASDRLGRAHCAERASSVVLSALLACP